MRPSQLPVLRVSQLDAESLETDLTTLLGYQLKTMFKFFDTDVSSAAVVLSCRLYLSIVSLSDSQSLIALNVYRPPLISFIFVIPS